VIPASLRLEGDRLIWLFRDQAKPDAQPLFADPKGALDAFRDIRDGEGVLRFARRYGVLGLCEHGLPVSHNPPPVPAQEEESSRMCYPLGWGSGMYWEPIERWLHFVRVAMALVRIAARLHAETASDPGDWVTLYEDTHRPELRDVAYWATVVRNSEDSWRLLTWAVDDWLRLARLRLTLVWEKPRPILAYQASTTFGVIAIQLAAAASQSNSVAVCSGCGKPYSRTKRQPAVGKRNWCDECKRNGVDDRIHKREERAGLAKPNRRSKNG